MQQLASKVTKLVAALEPRPTTANLLVQSVRQGGTQVDGLWTVIQSADGEVVKTGATPLTFVGTSGAEYPVTVSNCESWVAAIAGLVAILDRSLSSRTRYLSGSRRIAVRSSPRGGALRFLGYHRRSGGLVAPFVPILGFGARPSERRLLSGFFFFASVRLGIIASVWCGTHSTIMGYWEPDLLQSTRSSATE